MVSIPALNAMKQYYDTHLEGWVKEHPGEWVVVCDNNHTIYPSKSKMRIDYPAIKELTFGTPPLIRQIPKSYRKPWSLMNENEQSNVVHRETTSLLKKLDVFEKRSRRSTLQLD